MICPCGHTFEAHGRETGCERCACDRDRARCLSAVIDVARTERTPYPSRVRKSSSLPAMSEGV